MNFAYNQNSYAFYPENDKCDLNHNYQSNTESQSLNQPEQPREIQQRLEKTAHTNRSSSKNGTFKRIERTGSKSQADQK